MPLPLGVAQPPSLDGPAGVGRHRRDEHSIGHSGPRCLGDLRYGASPVRRDGRRQPGKHLGRRADEHGGRAVINGTYLLVGQEKNGFRLLSVGKRSATVEFGDETIELKIDASQEKNDLQDGM